MAGVARNDHRQATSKFSAKWPSLLLLVEWGKGCWFPGGDADGKASKRERWITEEFRIFNPMEVSYRT
jgi:hypothetical protein